MQCFISYSIRTASFIMPFYEQNTSTFFSQTLVHILQECQYLMFLIHCTYRMHWSTWINLHRRLNYTFRVFFCNSFWCNQIMKCCIILENKLSWYVQTRHINQHSRILLLLFPLVLVNEVLFFCDNEVQCFNLYEIFKI